MGAARPGYILIAVLWSLALIGAVAAAYAASTRTMVSQAGADIERAQAHYAARGVCVQTVKDLAVGVRRAQLRMGASRQLPEGDVRIDDRTGGVQVGNLPEFPAEMAAAGGFLGAIAQRLGEMQGAEPTRPQRQSGRGSGSGGSGGGGSGGEDRGVNTPVDETDGEAEVSPLIVMGTGEMTLDGVRVEVWLESESGKLNINASPRSMLESLLVQLGHEQTSARAIIDEIEDYRVSLLAPNDPQRRARLDRAAFQPLAGREFSSIEQLSNIASLDGAIRDRLLGMLTVYSSGAIDPNYAPGEVLRAIGLFDERALDMIYDFQAARRQIRPETLRETMGTAAYSRASGWLSFSAPPVFTARTRATVGQTSARYLIRVAPAGGDAGQAGVTRLLECREDWL